jgi:hypothetical protein
MLYEGIINSHLMSKVTFTRKQLYDLVWSQPLIQLAKVYKISGLRKVCKRHDVPTPNNGYNGYWTQLQFGKAPPPDPLPDGEESKIRLKLRDGFSRPFAGLLPAEMQALSQCTKEPIRVAKNLSKEHQLVGRARCELQD